VTNTNGVEEVSRSFNFIEPGPRGGINEKRPPCSRERAW